MKDIILSSSKILILLPDELTVDIFAASFGLAYSLTSIDKKISFGYSSKIPDNLNSIFDFKSFEIINSIKKSEIILSVNRKKGKVKSVRWREEDDKIQFIITPENSNFEFQDVDLENIGSDFDLVIVTGCSNLDKTGQIYLSNPQYFNDIKIINIDISASNTNFGLVNKVGKDLSLSSYLIKLLEEEELPINKNVAESLFKGIFWANEGFRQNNELRKSLEKLISLEGDLSEVLNQMYNSLTISELRYIGKIISNVIIHPNDFISSKVLANDIQGVNIERIVYPEINLLSRVKNSKVAIILSEYEPNKILIKIYSKDDSINILKIFSTYTPTGNSKKITMYIEGDIEKIEEKLIKELNDYSQGITKPSTQNSESKDNINVQQEKTTTKEDKKAEPLKEADTLPKAIESPSYYPQTTQQFPQVSQPPQMHTFSSPIYPSQPLPPVQNTF